MTFKDTRQIAEPILKSLRKLKVILNPTPIQEAMLFPIITLRAKTFWCLHKQVQENSCLLVFQFFIICMEEISLSSNKEESKSKVGSVTPYHVKLAIQNW